MRLTVLLAASALVVSGSLAFAQDTTSTSHEKSGAPGNAVDGTASGRSTSESTLTSGQPSSSGPAKAAKSNGMERGAMTSDH